MELVLKSLRLPSAVVDGIEQIAAETGLTFSDVVEVALRKELNMPVNALHELILEASAWLRSRYPTGTQFPQDVTLRTVHQIRDEPVLRALYDGAVSNGSGSVDPDARHVVHRQVGRMVKRVLGARVVGRSNPLDPSVHLISSHALLAQ